MESPLLVAVAAGSAALPVLLKLMGVLAAQRQALPLAGQLPVEVPLGPVRPPAPAALLPAHLPPPCPP